MTKDYSADPGSENRWQRVKRIFNEALEHDPVRREDYLTRACGGDDSLRGEVEALLAQEGAAAFMRAPAMEVAAQVMAAGRDKAGGKPMIGRSVGSYQIIEKIGQGGWGSSIGRWIRASIEM